MYKIGIGVTTYKRKALLQECLDNIHKFTERPFKLYVAEDTDADRKGIALRKNECLFHLQDCDYIFLFDDDCFPIKSGWEKFFIEASNHTNYHHFNYLKSDIHLEKNFHFQGDYTIQSYHRCGGVFLFLTKEVLQKVGGFYDKYEFHGFEHLGYTLRIMMSGLIPEMYLCPSGADEYLFAYDYEVKDFQSTIPNDLKHEMNEKNKFLLEKDCESIYREIIWEK
jgi:GT2 family glycosyltransferase